MGCGSRGWGRAWGWGDLFGGCGYPDPYPYPAPRRHVDQEYAPQAPGDRGAERQVPPPQSSGAAQAQSPEIAIGIADLQRQKTEVERAEQETVELLENLRSTAERLHKDMDRYEGLAKGAVGIDEAQARVYLQRRQAAAEQEAALNARTEELAADLDQLRISKAGLEAKTLDMTALDQRERLARLDGQLKGLKA